MINQELMKRIMEIAKRNGDSFIVAKTVEEIEELKHALKNDTLEEIIEEAADVMHMIIQLAVSQDAFRVMLLVLEDKVRRTEMIFEICDALTSIVGTKIKYDSKTKRFIHAEGPPQNVITVENDKIWISTPLPASLIALIGEFYSF